ncbi:MAG TPA: GAF domain-containing protein, partial [Candidatus Berkiella sp.]|nr:GAF domain-containing protein [Candidatus Berkiella sp.]
LIIQANHAIVRIRDREQLLKEICQILSEHGRFTYAWIGIGESAEHQPDVIVTSDKNNNYVHLLFQSIAAFPFKMASGTQGVMALYAKGKNFFNKEEVALLRILATNIGYGLSDIENKSQ